MRQLRYCVPVALAAALIALPARSCGPDFPEAIFVLPNGPGGDYALFAAGRLGVPQAGYRTRNLVVAYDYLTQRPLSAAEQKQAVDVNEHFVDAWSYEQAADKSGPPTGFALWIAARAGVGAVDKYVPSEKLETSLYRNYDEIPNCLDDAFATATRTLAARSAAYGKQDAAVIEWVRGQDAVFANCNDGHPRGYNEPAPPAPAPASLTPAALPATAPVWLQQDRRYQMAAAAFYAARYDEAIAQFRAIAADSASPWSTVARYLVARALIRKATMQDAPSDGNLSGTPLTDEQRSTRQAAYQQQLKQASQQRTATLQQAQHELLAMQTEPRMATMRNAVDNLLDYLNLRVNPDAQAVVLADRLHGPATDRFAQALIDLTYLRTDHADAILPVPANTPKPGASDMLAWIDDINTVDQTPNEWSGDPSPHTAAEVAQARADILQHWRAGKSMAWLLAAIMTAKPTDADAAELVRAAQAVSKDDPGYVAIMYHRLRLSANDPATRPGLLAMLPAIERDQTLSTINLFTALDAKSAPTLEAWLSAAGRVPAGDTSYDTVDDYDPSAPAKTANGDEAAQPVAEDVCGTKVKPNTTKLFDLDAANALNRDVPLRLLAAAAESSSLPANLQFQVAQAAWARAVLLDQPAIARRMTPLLVHCRAAWQPVLAAYDASTTSDDRLANGLLALMRFASTEPSVRYGEERRNGFAGYDAFRQNWWCTTVPKPGYDVDYSPDLPAPRSAGATSAPPIFLSASDLAEARGEIASLEKIPTASTYFARQALAWMKAHPGDARTADILGEATRALRNSCRTERPYDSKTGQPAGDPKDPNLTANLAHALFDALHQNYPQSAWTKRYTSWE
jgi:hypothetical protein